MASGRSKWTGAGGTTIHGPLKTILRNPGTGSGAHPGQQEIRDEAFLFNPRARCDYREDFLGDLSPTDLGIPLVLYDYSPAGTPTQAVVADAAHGQLEQTLSSSNEVSTLIASWGNQLAIPFNARPYFEARIQIPVAITTAESAFWGLGNAYVNGAYNTFTRRMFFRLDASMVLTLEATDGTNTHTAQLGRGVTLSAATWYWIALGIDSAGFLQGWVASGDGQNERSFYRGGYNMGSVSTDTMQPILGLNKASGTTTPSVLTDAVRCSWDRTNV